MIQKRAFSTTINHKKILCFIIVFMLTIPFGTVISKKNNDTSKLYSGDDCEIFLSEENTDEDYIINLEFLISDYSSESVICDSESYLSLNLGYSSTYTIDIGKPKLPTIRKLIAIPYESSYTLKILEKEYNDIKLENKKILPLQQPTYDCNEMYDNNEFIIDSNLYSTDNFYPDELISIVKDDIVFRDFSCILLQFNPIMYNPFKNKIRFFNKLNIQLEFDKEPMRIKESKMLEDIYEGIVLNYDIAKDWASFKDNNIPSYDDYDFLIITDDDFYQSMIPFKDFKVQTGLNTRIAKTSETGTNPTDILDYIKNAYNNEGISYVLLVGDNEHIPIKQDGDHYYTCLEGNDLYPEIAIGRFSVKTNQHVNNIVAKTIDYGFFSSNDDGYEKKILLVADGEGAPRKYQGCKEYIANNIIPSEMIISKAYYAEGARKQNVIDYMNQGQLIVNYRGHGSTTSWRQPSIGISDLTNLNNEGKLPLIFSISCNNGQITSECIAEKSHRDESSCIGYLAASKPSPTTENHEFDKDLFRAIYNHEKTVIGDIIFHAKSALLEDFPAGADVKMYILFGDPTTELQGGGPRLSFNPSSYHFGNLYKKEMDSTSFEICNSGSEILTYTLSENCNWVELSRIEGSISEGDCDTIDISIDTTGLSYGNNSCQIFIKSNDGDGVFDLSVNVVSHPPDKPTDPKPSDGVSGVSVDPTFLSVDVSDPDDDLLSVSFFDAGDDSEIGFVDDVESGETVTVEWDGLDYNTSYSWYVVVNDSVFETVSDVFGFTTNSPPVFSNMFPMDGSLDVSFGVANLSLDISDPDGDSFSWSISTSSNIGSNYSSGDVDGTKFCNVDGLMPDTLYTWTVSATDERGASNQAVYSFKTKKNNPPEKPVAVSPADNAEDVSIICFLNWSCFDPDPGDILTYDVFFGKTNNPELVEEKTMDSSYVVPYDLDLDTTYYWKIKATDSFGASSESSVFSFRTSPVPPPPSPGSIDIGFPKKFSWAGIKTSIMNKGVRDASNVLWEINISGGVFDRLSVSESGCINRLNSSETEEISTYEFLDFKNRVSAVGRIKIAVKTFNINGEVVDFKLKDAFAFGPLVLFLN